MDKYTEEKVHEKHDAMNLSDNEIQRIIKESNLRAEHHSYIIDVVFSKRDKHNKRNNIKRKRILRTISCVFLGVLAFMGVLLISREYGYSCAIICFILALVSFFGSLHINNEIRFNDSEIIRDILSEYSFSPNDKNDETKAQEQARQDLLEQIYFVLIKS